MSQPQESGEDISPKESHVENARYKSIMHSSKENSESKNTLYIVTADEIFQKVTNRLSELSAHFDRTEVKLLSIKTNLSEIESAVKACIERTDHSMCILSSQNTFHTEILDYYDQLSEPSNLGNCSSDGKEIWNAHSGFVIDPNKHLFLSNIIQIGLQLQLTPASFFDAMDEEFYEHYRIGHFKQEMGEVEPIMRDLNIFQLSCNTLRKADFQAKYDSNPSGFFAEEAIQLIKYASLSPYLSFLLIHDINTDNLDAAATDFLAQTIWYATHGVDVRLDDSPYNPDHMQEYIVDHDYYDFPISFLKSKKSGRWWIKVPNDHEDRAPYICISCSEKDYLEVFENRIPNRLLRAIERNR